MSNASLAQNRAAQIAHRLGENSCGQAGNGENDAGVLRVDAGIPQKRHQQNMGDYRNDKQPAEFLDRRKMDRQINAVAMVKPHSDIGKYEQRNYRPKPQVVRRTHPVDAQGEVVNQDCGKPDQKKPAGIGKHQRCYTQPACMPVCLEIEAFRFVVHRRQGTILLLAILRYIIVRIGEITLGIGNASPLAAG